jgi:hypothetical protein
MKVFIVAILSLMFSSVVFAEPSPYGEAYVVTLNTTTFTVLPVGRTRNLYNPGAYDIKIASASTSATSARFTVKAATYLPCPVLINNNLYAIATDSNSVSLEVLVAK